MALDEALLESLRCRNGPAVIRLYQWQEPTLSLGYAQSARRFVNVDFCRKEGISVVRRMTGGRSVLHHKELTYAVVSPDKSSLFPGGIQENYRVIARVLQETLRRFGLCPTLVSGRGKTLVSADEFQHNVCFHSPSLYELTVAGRKVTGSAQTRRQGFFLQHGSLPLEMDMNLLAGALSPAGEDHGQSQVPVLSESVGWINRFASRSVTVTELQEALIAAFEGSWGICLKQGEITPEEMDRAQDLQKTRYQNDAWTYRR